MVAMGPAAEKFLSSESISPPSLLGNLRSAVMAGNPVEINNAIKEIAIIHGMFLKNFFRRRFQFKPDIADDLTQEVTLKLLLKADIFNPAKKDLPYLRTIAYFCAVDYLRRNKDSLKNISLDAEIPRRFPSDEVSTYANLVISEKTKTPDEIGSIKELARLAINFLQEKYPKGSCLLMISTGMTYPEVAEKMKMNLNSVKSRLAAEKKAACTYLDRPKYHRKVA
jgi:RNA polymerase sigma factor (sigma-70 family)